jgi:hypothetical protein
MDDGDRTKYFAKMSRAYALKCGGLAMLMTKDPDDIPDDGIWAQTEQPTLERESDFAPPRQLTSLVCPQGLAAYIMVANVETDRHLRRRSRRLRVDFQTRRAFRRRRNSSGYSLCHQ